MAIYAVSDIHGQYNTFLAGLEKIHLKSDDMLYVIGDAIDRGPEGIKILQHIKNHNNMDMIIGNHEFMMLNSVDHEGKNKCNGEDADLWLYYNGGWATFQKYEKLALQTRKNLLAWLNERYVIKTIDINGTSFCLTHSYYDEKFENKKYNEMGYEDIGRIVWTSYYRDDRESHGSFIYRDYEHIFITGHVPVHKVMIKYEGHLTFNELRVFEKGNFIDIDGGCAMGYYEGLHNGLLFLRLDDLKVFTVPVIV